MQNFVVMIKKHLIILSLVCIISVIGLYILGNFIELHPDAYIDLIRSIVVVYVFVLLSAMLFVLISQKTSFGSKVKTLCSKKELKNPIVQVSVVFTTITLINNIMMITNIDRPKEGLFAYVHMMIRVAIITTIVLITMNKVVQWTKKVSFLKIGIVFTNFVEKHKLLAISVMFTLFSIGYCITIILFSGLLQPKGGIEFYIIQLLMLALFSVIVAVKSILKKV